VAPIGRSGADAAETHPTGSLGGLLPPIGGTIRTIRAGFALVA
jgi:hypothetical protein